MLEFDDKGHLIPYNVIELSYKNFIANFVKQFPLNSTRHQIFNNFEVFLGEFSSKVYPNFQIWINGSFVTKKVNPNDIDCLIFINYEWLKENELKLSDFKNKIKNDRLDVYFLIEYSANHEFRVLTETDTFYWKDWFSRTRINRSGKSSPKGFVELQF